MKRSSIVLMLAVGIAAAAALVGCTPVLIAPTEPSGATPPSATPTPTEATAPADPMAITCDSLVSPENKSKYAAAGWTLSDDYAERQIAEGQPNAAFVEYGGALCMWGVPSTDNTEVLGGSAIDDTQEAAQRARLDAEGYVLDEHNGADRYSLTDSNGFEHYYAFTGDYWFFGSTADALDRTRQFADRG